MPRGIPNQAKDTPVILNKQRVDSTDIETPQEAPRTLASTGPAEKALDPRLVVTQDRPMDPEKMAMLAFMAESVDIRIADTSDPNAEQIFEVTVNGRVYPFRRGEVKTVPRYVADWLARQRKEGFKSRETMNAEGIKDVVYDSRTARMYDFSIERDANPVGREWLKAAFAGR